MALLRRNKYKDERALPQQPFFLVDPQGLEMGPYDPRNFGRNGAPEEDGALVHATGEGSPLFLRITRQDGDKIWTQDSTGATWEYRISTAPALVA
jgi:hypothetical protein